MKTFTCVICGEEVSKRQSSAFNNGRACKTHSETKECVILKKTKESKRIAAEQEKTKKKKNRKSSFNFPEPGMFLCWGCEKSGISFRQAMMHLLVSSEKIQMVHEAIGTSTNFLDIMNEAQKDAKSKITTCVISIYPVPEEKIEKVMLSVDFLFRAMIKQEKKVSFCSVCAEKHDLTMALPKVDIKTLGMMGGIYKDIIKPGIQEIAKVEMAGEAIQN